MPRPTPVYDPALRRAIALALVQLRNRAGHSQLTLQAASGISLRHIANLEKGTNNPGMEMVARYLAPLKCDLIAFAREVEKAKKKAA